MDIYALDDQAQRRRGKRRRALLAILLASSLATLGAGAMSLAVFTDADAADGAWSTGTIRLVAGPAATFGASDMFPGDTGEQTVTVLNDGTGELRYAMTSTETDADGLLAQMTLEIFEGACTAKGLSLYSGSFAAAALGNPAQTGHAGDRVVAAGVTDSLCFAWELPLATDDAFQNVTATAVFDFLGEQTANNP
jgi:hypothetical protein